MGSRLPHPTVRVALLALGTILALPTLLIIASWWRSCWLYVPLPNDGTLYFQIFEGQAAIFVDRADSGFAGARWSDSLNFGAAPRPGLNANVWQSSHVGDEDVSTTGWHGSRPPACGFLPPFRLKRMLPGIPGRRHFLAWGPLDACRPFSPTTPLYLRRSGRAGGCAAGPSRVTWSRARVSSGTDRRADQRWRARAALIWKRGRGTEVINY